MKRFVLFAAAALLAGPALAQDSRPAPRTGPTAPDFTQGSGQRSGGPANELNPSTGMPGPATTGTVIVDPASPNARQMPMNPSSQAPAYQQGSGQESGGPAKELNRQ